MKGKKAALALTCGGGFLDSVVLNALGMFRDAFEFLGIEHVGTVHASCNAAGEVRDNADAVASAREIGRQLGRPCQFRRGARETATLTIRGTQRRFAPR